MLADGAFYLLPQPFKQIYSIHSQIMGSIIPFIYALLPDKTQLTYKNLLIGIKEICIEKNITFQPTQLIMDFEVAAMNAWEEVFPNIQVKGCLFHYGQSIWRKIQNLGLSAAYNNHEEFGKWARLIFALPLIPLAMVDDVWHEHIIATAPSQVIYLYNFDIPIFYCTTH